MKKKNNKWVMWSLIIFVLVLLTFAIYKAKSKPKGKSVTFELVELKTIKETVTASGKVYPETEVKISSDVSGEIVELYVQEGDSVVIGQILAKINPDVYISAVERGEASLNAAKSQQSISKAQIESSKGQKEQIVAQLENAKNIHKRNEQLKKDGVISQADLEQSLSSLMALEASLRGADASIRSAEKNLEASGFGIKGSEASLRELMTSLDRTTIRAPRSGIVSSLSVEKGERVVGTMQMTGTEMMRISNLNTMEVQVNVSENDILKVKLDDDVDIEVDAYLGQKFKGKVTHIANSASNIKTLGSQAVLSTDQVTNFVVKIRVLESSYQAVKTSNNKYVLRPGMSASVDIFTKEEKDVIAVPIQAVTIREKSATMVKSEIDAKDYDEVVFVLENDTAKMLIVKTGIQDNEFIHILSGLEGGEKVVSGPYSELSKNLKSGDRLREKKDTNDKK